MSIFIQGNVPSLKNSKQIIRMNGKPKLVPSKLHAKYLKKSARYWEAQRSKFLDTVKYIDPPYRVEFYFIRETKHQFDYDNVLSTVFDAMTKFKWIEDDNADVIIPVIFPYDYDKDNPGVYIEVLHGKT